jgi:hypothetical protein
VSTTPECVMFSAARTLEFQSPPYERPGDDEVLLLRQQDDVWEFPRVGQFDHGATLESWTDGTYRARVEAPFDPPGMDGRDFQWVSRNFAITCEPSVYASNVLPALRRFDGSSIDQILARVEALANSQGDSMSTSTAELKRQVDALERRLGPPAGDPQEFRQAQAKADVVAHAYGDAAAPAPLAGERLHDYRVRLLSKYQVHSKAFRDSNLYKIGDPTALSGVEDCIYNDAMAALRDPSTFGPGELRAIKSKDATGREITRYHGDPNACWDRFNPPIKYVRRFSTSGRAA